MGALLLCVGGVQLATVAVLLVATIRSLLLGGKARRFLVACAGRLATRATQLAAFLRRPRDPGHIDDEDAVVQLQVEALLAQRSVRFTRSLVIICSVVLAARMVPMMADIFSGKVIDMAPENVIAITVALVSSALGVVRPDSINRRTVLWWHLWYMAIICFGQSPLGEDSTRGMLRALLAVESIGVGCMCIRLPVLAVSYACLSFCVVWTYRSSAQLPGGVALSDIVLTEVTVYGVKMLIFAHLDATLTFGAEQEVQAKLGRCQRSAVSSLLGMVCDAVVDMDSELRLKRHEETLSSLLMQGAGKCLHGASIMSCIASDGEGQGSFQASIDANARGEGGSPTPGMFAARLRDALGNSIRVTVYHVPYPTISGDVHHLLGVREDSDTKEPSLPEAVLADGVAERLAARRSASAGPPSLSGSSGSGTASVPGGHTLTIDVALAEGLPSRGASQHFRDTFGECDRFLDAVQGDGGALVAWLRERAERVGAGAAPRVESFGELAMRRPGGPGQRHNLRACFPPPPEGGGEYEVSIRLGRRCRGATALGLGTSAASEPQELGPLRGSAGEAERAVVSL